MLKNQLTGAKLSYEDFRVSVLADYRIACESREVSVLGRKEVLTGKAKFGIFGDGKEVPQIAMAKAFRKGDFRSGYYRDQTFVFALGEVTVEEYFAQLYANPDPKLNTTFHDLGLVEIDQLFSDFKCTGHSALGMVRV